MTLKQAIQTLEANHYKIFSQPFQYFQSAITKFSDTLMADAILKIWKNGLSFMEEW